MNRVTTLMLWLALFGSANGNVAIIDHDKVQPFAQPEPVTISEKVAVKFKPQLLALHGCASFPAVNAAGEINGGLKGTKGTAACKEAPLGSQVYGRSAWHQDKWAMLFAWYFPKNLRSAYNKAKKRHDWASIVLWIDNPALETPKLLGVSLSQQTPEGTAHPVPGVELYRKLVPVPEDTFAGYSRKRLGRHGLDAHTYTVVPGSNITTRFAHSPLEYDGWLAMDTLSGMDGSFQDLIMWNQLTDAARAALESANFEDTRVPFNDKNFEENLKAAWPF